MNPVVYIGSRYHAQEGRNPEANVEDGWVIRPVKKTVGHITYIVLVQT